MIRGGIPPKMAGWWHSDGYYRDKEERKFDYLPALPRILWYYDLELRHRKTCNADSMNDGI
jgi:hypothetical protein